MRSLQQFAQDHPPWILEEFVQITNELLPQFLPESPGNTRVREERSHSSQGKDKSS